jgi:putative Ca2+/H+ antiporter (TMEM165/GDT1 family)
MDLRLFASAFAAVFLAELGDKTQLAALTLSASSARPWTVFLASSLALVLSAGLAVLAGGWLTRHVSPLWLQRIAGATFVLLGLWTLWRSGAAESS